MQSPAMVPDFLYNLDENIVLNIAGIYLHIPFCHKACHYCGFYFTTKLDRVTALTDSLCKELELQSNSFSEPIHTVYFGGGTPSILPVESIGKILNTIQKFYRSDWKEVTIEANPEDLSSEYLKGLKSVGINRLSIGTQTFDDELLEFINRNHNSNQAIDAFETARSIGFKNINLDLIYALPKSSDQILIKDLDIIRELKPEHVSIYAFTTEPKTAFENWIKRGLIKPQDEETEAMHYETIQAHLSQSGYEQYEVSNFCLDEAISMHNSSYWDLVPYLGVGPSAHSFDGANRWHNPSNLKAYIDSIDSGSLPLIKEERQSEDLINEYLFTSLRTKWGVDLNKITQKWNIDLSKVHSDILIKYQEMNLLKIEDHRIILTPKGLLLADHIAGELFF